MRETPSFWTVAECLGRAPSLALPAFQRGAVWDHRTAAHLLESLDDGFFVGSLLVWQPADHQAAAAPLLPGAALADRPALVIDGQQRLRALLDVLVAGHRCRRETIVAGRTASAGRLWCARLRGDKLQFSLRRFPGDRKEKDWTPLVFLDLPDGACPGRWKPGASDVYGWRQSRGKGTSKTRVWVDCAFSYEAWREQDFIDDDVIGYERSELQSRLQRLLDARLAVVELREEPGRWSEAEVIENYRRLNGSGERLTGDELDYARLVPLARKAPVAVHLARVLQARPGGTGDSTQDTEDVAQAAGLEDEDVSRDDVLSRGAAREFGLNLFVRSVREARAYREASSSSSKKLPDPADVAAAPGDPDLWMQEAADVLVVVGRAFSSLGLDWRARIPRDGMGRLRSLEVLLLRFPELRGERGQPVVRAIVLRLITHPALPEAEQLVPIVLGSSRGAQAARELLDALRFDSAALSVEVVKDQSARSRWKDVLYWWLRHRRARDIPADGTRGERLTAGMSPEAQHIVPFSRVRAKEKLKRSTTHAVNAVGNTTWISHRANTLGTGWEDRFMSLDADPENADRHLLGSGHYPEIAARYGASKAKVPESRVEAFAAIRAELFARELHAWCESEEESALKELSEAPDGFGKFVPRRPTPSDILLDWGYPSSLVRRLTRIYRAAFARSSSSATGWKSSGYNRARRVEGDRPERMTQLGRVELEVRLAGDSAPLEDRLVASRESLSLPSPGGVAVEVAVTDLADPSSLARVEKALAELFPTKAEG